MQQLTRRAGPAGLLLQLLLPADPDACADQLGHMRGKKERGNGGRGWVGLATGPRGKRGRRGKGGLAGGISARRRGEEKKRFKVYFVIQKLI